MTIRIRSLKPVSVLKYVAGSYLMIYLLLALLFGSLGVLGFHTVRWNREAITGIWALPCALFVSGFMWLGSTVLTWLALVIGFPIFSLVFQPELEGDDAKEASPGPDR